MPWLPPVSTTAVHFFWVCPIETAANWDNWLLGQGPHRACLGLSWSQLQWPVDCFISPLKVSCISTAAEGLQCVSVQAAELIGVLNASMAVQK